MKWVLFRFQNGSNPYITKTEEETKRILQKYKNRVKKISEHYYYITEPKQINVWWNN